MFAHHWDQGLLFGLVFLFYFIFITHPSLSYVNSPCAIRQRGGGTSSSCDAFPCEHAKCYGLVRWARQVRSGSVLARAAVMADRATVVDPFRATASAHPHPLIPITIDIAKTSLFASAALASLPSSLVAVPVSVLFFDTRWWWLVDAGSLMNVGCHDTLQRLSSYHVVNAAKLEL